MYLNSAEAALKNHHPDSETAVTASQLLEKRYQSTAYSIQAETDINAMDDNALLDEIYLQRRLELSYEGHLWFDIRRMEKNKRPNIDTGIRGANLSYRRQLSGTDDKNSG